MQREIAGHAGAVRQHRISGCGSGELFLQTHLLIVRDRSVIREPSDETNPQTVRYPAREDEAQAYEDEAVRYELACA